MKFFNYFSCKEFFPNCSPEEIAECFKLGFFDNLLTLLQVLDSIRDSLNVPIIITSSYRSNLHNKKAGGVETSQHIYGAAIDFKTNSMEFFFFSSLVEKFLQESALQRFVGQVIFYHKREFIHIGLRTPSHKDLNFIHYEQRNN